MRTVTWRKPKRPVPEPATDHSWNLDIENPPERLPGAEYSAVHVNWLQIQLLRDASADEVRARYLSAPAPIREMLRYGSFFDPVTLQEYATNSVHHGGIGDASDGESEEFDEGDSDDESEQTIDDEDGQPEDVDEE